ncbi:MAG: hypothetical protein P8H35_07735 [Flavobacteriales bacterium]|nr:hypothetical protein [Flavobacteriales bacterium]
MRIVLLVILSSFYFNMYSQSAEAKNKILLVKENLEQVPPYSCEIKIKIDVSFINIKEREGKMTFLGPNDINYKIKGFAFLPKKEMGGISSNLFNSEFIAVSMGSENNNEIIKVIPMDINADIVTGQFWITNENLIDKMIIITKDKGSYTAYFTYEDIPYNIPSQIKMSFDVKNQKMPALLTGDLESYTEEIEDVNEVSKGEISIKYFNHIFEK